MQSFGGAVKLSGESEYRKAISQITQQLKIMSSEMSIVTAKFGKNNISTESLTQRNKILNQEIEKQQEKIATLKGALEDAQKEYGENSKQANSWQISLNKAEAELISLQKELKANNSILSQNEKATKNSANSLSGFVSATIKGIIGTQDFGKTLKKDIVDNFNNSALKQGIDNVKNGINNFKDALKDAADGSINVSDVLKNKLNKAANDMINPIKNDKQAMDDFSKSEDDAGKKTLSLGDIIKANLISEGIMAGVKKLADGMKQVASATFDVIKQSLDARGEIEQSIGGVETLFKDSADTVIENANNAYKTSGLSANEYMQNVTSFSASLLQSVSNDTDKAARIADMAMIDMSDNANKMGTDMSSIQSAYQGFAKQNYTMLDNLKLRIWAVLKQRWKDC